MLSGSDPNLLAITVPAHPDQLPRMRDRMRRWLSDRDISPTCADIVLAADEALANSVEHA